MKTPAKKYLWILIANAILLVAVGAIFTYRMKAEASKGISATVNTVALHGDMVKMELYDPRKNLPHIEYIADMRTASDIRDLKGQWTLVNLWASWCAPCLTELPALQKLNDVYEGQGFRVVAISVDTAQDGLEIEGTIAMHKLGKIARNWDYNGDAFRTLTDGALPISFIVDPEGKVYSRLVGDAKWASPEGLAFVDSLLAATKN